MQPFYTTARRREPTRRFRGHGHWSRAAAERSVYVFLYAREGSDLRVLRVTGAGLTALEGLN
jgi:hypothetical protein